MERATIEIAPLAYMRGRTLNNAFIILDEAQNSTTEQMLMFLTRLGHGSKAVITGDETQIDLPPHKHSGLVEAHRALKHTEGIAIVEFSKRDVVRHPLVQRIIAAYEEHRGKAKSRMSRHSELIVIANRQRTKKINSCSLLEKNHARRCCVELKIDTEAELGINLVGAKEMARVNWNFLRHEGSTDVITFDYPDGETRSRNRACTCTANCSSAWTRRSRRRKNSRRAGSRKSSATSSMAFCICSAMTI